ncbi:DNA polymerase III subunit epsilon [Actinophytocola sp.]|uniref:DNA polymerase III subunit epsilon n=1 Tax=Actinophytocola sp. TaxID=1872138 RepID=UPI002D808584|nr:DNA polymerase III subunit epsilon [Actinophytocola sp.]HET9144117.1 DNA polymerase III subunit epsilon [Actinophytocola sp.]
MSRAPWLDGRIHAFDLETTGIDVENDRIVTGTWLTGSADGLESTTNWLVDPGVEIPKQASDVHGVTTEYAREHGGDPREAVGQMVELLCQAWVAREPVVIYNAPYDLTLLDREMRRQDWPGYPEGLLASPVDEDGNVCPPLVVDPLVCDKRLEKYVRGKGGRKLVNACARYGIVLTDEEAHTSQGDTTAAWRLAWKMAHRMPISGMTLHELQEAQRDWHRAQARDFANYLAKTGKAADAERVRGEAGQWPIRPFVAATTETVPL